MKASRTQLTPLGLLSYLSHNMVSWNKCLVVVYYQFHYMHTYVMPFKIQLYGQTYISNHVNILWLQYNINAQHTPTIVKVTMNVTMLYLCHWVWASRSFEINKWENIDFIHILFINFSLMIISCINVSLFITFFSCFKFSIMVHTINVFNIPYQF
jgi:hypothetical protein